MGMTDKQIEVALAKASKLLAQLQAEAVRRWPGGNGQFQGACVIDADSGELLMMSGDEDGNGDARQAHISFRGNVATGISSVVW